MHDVLNQAHARVLKCFPSHFYAPKYLPIVLKVMFTLLLWGALSVKGLAFDSFEHRYIGNQAFTKLELDKDKKNPVKQDWMEALRLLGLEEKLDSEQSSGLPQTDYLAYARSLPLRFGDLTALAGDHVDNPTNLLAILDLLKKANDPEPKGKKVKGEAKRFVALRRQWLSMCAWVARRDPGISATIKDLNDCAKIALENEDQKLRELLENGEPVPNPLFGTEGYSPSRVELAEFEQLPNFVGLAAENESHFATYSWKAYSDNHEKAIQFAFDYAHFRHGEDRSKHKNEDVLELLQLAIVHEGFAQHFLHDSFASGHLGTPFSRLAQKDLISHTHDTLDRIGEYVYTPLPIDFLWPGGEFSPRSAESKMKKGWTAFGDRHLFIPEAAFQRVVIIEIANQSLLEVFKASKGEEKGNECRMCTSFIFPRPEYLRPEYLNQVEREWFAVRDTEDFRLLAYEPVDLIPPGISDVRVPPLYMEGWKLSTGYGVYAGPYKDGGSVWDLSKSNRSKPSASAVTIELGYRRTTGPWIPNYYGAGFVEAPGVRTSIYPFSIGYWWPNEITERGIESSELWLPWWLSWVRPDYGGFRFNAGLRVNAANSFLNSSTKDKISGEITLVGDMGWQIFGPVGLFIRAELATANIQGSIPKNPQYSTDSFFGNGAGEITFIGLSYNLAGIQ